MSERARECVRACVRVWCCYCWEWLLPRQPSCAFRSSLGAPDFEDSRPSVRKERQTARVECTRIFDTAGRQRENDRDNPGASTFLQDSVLIMMLVLQRQVSMRKLLMHVHSLSGNDTSRNKTRVAGKDGNGRGSVVALSQLVPQHAARRKEAKLVQLTGALPLRTKVIRQQVQ